MKWRDQLDLMEEVRRKSNINLVTCGRCGTLLFHKMNDDKVDCPSCIITMDVHDCPDYLYEGMPELDDEL